MSYRDMPTAHVAPNCQEQEFSGDRFHRCEEGTRPHRSHRCECGRMWGGDYTPAEVSRYASEVLGLDMLPWQADYAAAYLNGTVTVLVAPRPNEKSATARLIAALCESAALAEEAADEQR
ncbi:hypothetical protein LJR045_000960 [Microbacterium sp. LjRoot45]|uniref:hypothetical protein n=1 Tax=Microbacterium sp. LjRoot45 TaxID=3342329 RepID=UPI003ECCE28C